MKVMITGHRPQRIKGREKEIKKWIEEQLEELQPRQAINGMAQGVDQIFAFVAKEKGIQLVNVYPHCRSNFHQDEEYLNEGALIVFYAEKYNKKNYTERDKKNGRCRRCMFSCMGWHSRRRNILYNKICRRARKGD